MAGGSHLEAMPEETAVTEAPPIADSPTAAPPLESDKTPEGETAAAPAEVEPKEEPPTSEATPEPSEEDADRAEGLRAFGEEREFEGRRRGEQAARDRMFADQRRTQEDTQRQADTQRLQDIDTSNQVSAFLQKHIPEGIPLPSAEDITGLLREHQGTATNRAVSDYGRTVGDWLYNSVVGHADYEVNKSQIDEVLFRGGNWAANAPEALIELGRAQGRREALSKETVAQAKKELRADAEAAGKETMNEKKRPVKEVASGTAPAGDFNELERRYALGVATPAEAEEYTRLHRERFGY